MGVSGCIDTDTPTRETAMEEFTDITELEPPMENIEEAARFVDEEAGVVFWGFYHQIAMSGSGSQFEVMSKSLEETDL